jgi:hypothetical protein
MGSPLIEGTRQSVKELRSLTAAAAATAGERRVLFSE